MPVVPAVVATDVDALDSGRLTVAAGLALHETL
jgi:hypothetical protein